MKKKKLLYISTLAFGLTVTSCSDSFLDMKNYGAYDDFDSETKITWYLGGLYDYYYYGYNSPNQQLVGKFGNDQLNWNKYTMEEWGFEQASRVNPDFQGYGSIDDIKAWDNGNKGADPFMAGYFGTTLGSSVTNNAYTRIRNCNILLRDIESAPVAQDIKNKAKGQALMLRAIQMFDLMRVYGRVPIVTEVLNSEVTEEGLPRASVTQVVEQIVNDLNEASRLLPLTWDAANHGRLSGAAALAYKSRVLLFYASPIFNKDWDNPNNVRWQKALKASQEAVAALKDNGLDGCSNGAEWGALLAKDDNKFNKEAIVVKLLSDDNVTSGNETNRWEGSIRPSSQKGSNGKAAPMEMIDLFPMADGTRPTNDDKIANGNLRFMENRDPRFYQTFAVSGIQWGYNGKENDVVWFYRWKTKDWTNLSYSSSDGNRVESPAYVRKMSGTTTPVDGTYGKSSIDIYEYRYAELILNLAECYAATGDIQNCKETLGKLRARVGIPQGDKYYGLNETVTDRHSAIESCLYEREVELAYEGKRFWDIWRWLLYDGGQNSLQLSATNTCTALGVQPLVGSSRTSKYVYVKDNTYALNAEVDPLATIRASISANPAGANFKTELTNLADFWESNLQFIDRPESDPVDENAAGEPAQIQWSSNYYIMGLSKTVLDNNAWLRQTKGWGDQNGATGTIDWQDDEVLTVE